jgi:hypothetical protein
MADREETEAEVEKPEPKEDDGIRQIESEDHDELQFEFVEKDEPRKTRQEKKQDRQRDYEGAVAEAAELRRRLEAVEARQAAPRATQPDPEDRELKLLEERRQTLAARAQAEIDKKTITQEQYREYEKEAQNIEDQKAELRAQKAARRALGSVEEKIRTEAVRSRFADINSNPRAGEWAKARFSMLAMEAADPAAASNDPDLLERVAQEARSKFKIGNRTTKREPSVNEKSRYEGTGKSSAAVGNAKGGRVVLTKHQRRMAVAMYPDDPESVAHKKWASRVGSKVDGLRR